MLPPSRRVVPSHKGGLARRERGLPPQMSLGAGVISPPPLPEVPGPLRGTRIATVTACYAGPAGGGAAMLGELTARTSEPVVNECRPLTPADLGNLGNVPGPPMPSRIRGVLLSGLPDDAVSELLRLSGQDPQSPLAMAEVRHLGGMFAQDPPGGGAIGRCEAPASPNRHRPAPSGSIRPPPETACAGSKTATNPGSVILPSFPGPAAPELG